MAKRPSYATASSLLRYEPETGNFYWLQSRGRVREGQIAGTTSNFKHGGKLRLLRCGEYHGPAGPVAWLLMTGKWPRHLIGFRNDDTLDCRWSNLMKLTQRTKTLRARARPDSESGIRGVQFLKRERLWRARIGWGSKNEKTLGFFKSREGAVTARTKAVVKATSISARRRSADRQALASRLSVHRAAAEP